MPSLSVKDFGPIENAQLDLRPLSIFIGASNTGKSYLAILIYALHRYFERKALGNHWKHPQAHPAWLDPNTSDVPRLNQAHIKWIKILENLDLKGSGIRDELHILEALAPVFRQSLNSTGGPSIGDDITRCFGLDAAALCRWNAPNGSSVIVRTAPASSSVPIDHRLSIGSANAVLRTDIPEDLTFILEGAMAKRLAPLRQLLEGDNTAPERAADLLRASMLLHSLEQYLLRDFFEPFCQRAYYIPADRTGIMHAHRVLVRGVIDSIPEMGLHRTRQLPALSGIMTDFLGGLIAMDGSNGSSERTNRPGELLAIARDIERDILEGAIITKNSEIIDYPEFFFRPAGREDLVPLKNASSMVADLAPIVLYLRHQAHVGDLLIIEEPESHLHPAMQVIFTRQLAAIVNAGVRVIITTHSEWVMEGMANLVRLSAIPPDDLKDFEAGEYALSLEQVGAWLFEAGDGSRVKEIELDEDSGLFPTGFDDVSIELHNNWARIMRRLENAA